MNKLSWQAFLLVGGVIFILAVLTCIFTSKQMEKQEKYMNSPEYQQDLRNWQKLQG